MKPLLVGEVNTNQEDPYTALWPPTNGSAKRLCKILDLTAEEYECMFDRVNLCYGEWDWKSARAMVEVLMKMSPYKYFILLGRRVATAFGCKDLGFFSTIRGPLPTRAMYLLLPHPSGRCRVWNNYTHVLLARRLVQSVLQSNMFYSAKRVENAS